MGGRQLGEALKKGLRGAQYLSPLAPTTSAGSRRRSEGNARRGRGPPERTSHGAGAPWRRSSRQSMHGRPTPPQLMQLWGMEGGHKCPRLDYLCAWQCKTDKSPIRPKCGWQPASSHIRLITQRAGSHAADVAFKRKPKETPCGKRSQGVPLRVLRHDTALERAGAMTEGGGGGHGPTPHPLSWLQRVSSLDSPAVAERNCMRYSGKEVIDSGGHRPLLPIAGVELYGMTPLCL